MYYERVNTHSASTSFAHACCGQRDASRNLVLDSRTPITKVRFSKGFAFANIEAASGKCLISNVLPARFIYKYTA